MERLKKVAVVILNWNGRKLLEEFLPSVYQFTTSEIADIIVVDNGSTDDSVSFLSQNYPNIQLLLFSENYGFAEGYNRAISQLDYEYVVLLNSDVEATPYWLEPLLSYCEEHPEVSACQPKLLSYRNKDYFEYAGASGGFIDRYGYTFCRGRIFDTVEKDIIDRDYRDMHREISPLTQAEDAVLVDSSNMSIDEVVKEIIKLKNEN